MEDAFAEHLKGGAMTVIDHLAAPSLHKLHSTHLSGKHLVLHPRQRASQS
jgi:hypothetical protein